MTQNGMPSLGLDGPEVGQAFESPGRTITETDVVSFAALTGDWHPQHADASWAASSRFGERVAHGMLVLSYSLGLVPLDPSRVVALRGVDDVVFKRPVRIGDTIRVEARVEGVKPLEAGTALVSLGWKVLNQSAETVVRARLSLVWRLDAAQPEAPTRAPEPQLDEVFL